MKQKLVSIILATYNCGPKVEKTIKSIISQNKDLFELIVIDGNSTDDTLETVRKYENDLILISEEDRGVYDAYNKGINLATGKYFYFIGAGDCLKADVLDYVKDVLQPENIDFMYGDAYFNKNQMSHGGEFSNLRLCLTNICQQAIFYHHKIFSQLGRFELRYKIYSDWVLNIKCYGSKEIRKKYIQKTIAEYEGGGLSETEKDNNFYKDLSKIIINNLGFQTYKNFLRQTLSCYSYLIFHDFYWNIYYPIFRPYVGHLIRFQVRAIKSVKNNYEKII